jgi:hypothetical protein
MFTPRTVDLSPEASEVRRPGVIDLCNPQE